MTSSKKDIENAILLFAKDYKQEEHYKALFASKYCSLPKIVELIVYELYINEFNPYYCSEEEFDNHRLILSYSKELREKGFVDFEM